MHAVAVFAGSFDPITLGHVDIVRRATAIFCGVHVAIGINRAKKYMFSLDERLRLVGESVSGIPGVSCGSYDGLLVDYCRRIGACVIVRGLRGAGDLASEQAMADANMRLSGGDVQTVFLTSAPEFSFVSSSFVREIYSFGRDVSEFVPKCVADFIYGNGGSGL